MNDHTHDHHAPTRRQLVDEAQRLAGDLVGTHGIDDATMSLEAVHVLARTPEGRARFDHYEAECDRASQILGDLAHWDAPLLHSAIPFLRGRQPDSLWRHLLLSAHIEADKRARPLEARATRVARAALSWIPYQWDSAETDALLEAPKHLERERAQMLGAGHGPFDTSTALSVIDRVLAERVFGD